MPPPGAELVALDIPARFLRDVPSDCDVEGETVADAAFCGAQLRTFLRTANDQFHAARRAQACNHRLVAGLTETCQ